MQPWWAARVVIFGGRRPEPAESGLFFRIRLASALPGMNGAPLLWWAAGVCQEFFRLAERPDHRSVGFVRSLRRLPQGRVLPKFRATEMCPIGATLHGAATLSASGEDDEAAIWAGACVALTIDGSKQPDRQCEYALLRYRHALALDCSPTARTLTRMERRVTKGLAPGVNLERLAGIEGWERGDLDGSLLRAWSLGWTLDELEQEIGCALEKISDDPEKLGVLDAATRTIGPSLRFTPADPRVSGVISEASKTTAASLGGGAGPQRSKETGSESPVSLEILARALGGFES